MCPLANATRADNDLSQTSSEALEDDDMGCVGAEADDVEAEFIRRICETELLSPRY